MVNKKPPSKTGLSATERSILKAARREFIEKGLEGARMQTIAHSAGVNKALLHYYYRSKHRLYRAALTEVIESVLSMLRKELEEGTASNDIQSLIHLVVSTYINTISENTDFIRLMFRELADGGKMLQEIVEGFIVSLGGVPQRILVTVMKSREKGIIRQVEPIHIFMNIIGMCVSTFIAPLVLETLQKKIDLGIKFDRIFYEERIREITNTALNGLLVKGDLL